MKFGIETASFVNHLYSAAKSPEPVVGMPATILSWTDRRPATVVEVNSKKRYIVVQEDNARRIDNNGMSESQEYEYTPNPEANRQVFRKMKDGSWLRHVINPATNRLVKRSGGLMLGRREKYHDFSF